MSNTKTKSKFSLLILLILSLCLSVFMFIGQAMTVSAAEGDVEINATNFPDENFRTYISENCDLNGDGLLSQEEIDRVGAIYVEEMNISSLQGIEYFTSIEGLDCYGNLLTSLDLSQNTALETLNCYNNYLTELNISTLTELGLLHCEYNNITSIDVSNSIKLYDFICDGNALSELDVSNNIALERLSCYENMITHIDLSANTSLETFTGSSQYITVAYNSNGQYTMPEGFDGANVTYVEGGSFDGNVLTVDTEWSTEYAYNTQLCYDYNAGNEKTFRVYAHVHSERGICSLCGLAINEANFPDENFRTYVSENIDADKDGLLSSTEISEVWEINVEQSNITDLTGIKYFTALEELFAGGNSFATLDLSGLPELYYLDVWGNGSLTSLDITDCTQLEHLDISSCINLESIDLTTNTELQYLNIDGIWWSSIDLSKNTKLGQLLISSTGFTTLDLSNNPEIYRLEGRSIISTKHCAVGYVNLNEFVDDISKILNVTYGTLGEDGWVKLDDGATEFFYDYDTGLEGYPLSVWVRLFNSDIEHTYVANTISKDATHHYTEWCETCHTGNEESLEAHNCVYTADGNVITETCSVTGCTHSETATLNAVENAVYSKNWSYPATITYSEDWAGGELTVTYSGTANDGTSYADAPVNAGEVTASMTIGDVTASTSYTIQKSPVTVGQISVESPETIYTGTALDKIVLARTNTTIPGTLALNAGQTLTVGTQKYNWTWTPDDTNNYKETTGTIELTVIEDVLQGIEITTEPRTIYVYGEFFDKTGMVVIATYASGNTVDVTYDVTIESEMLTAATTSVSISYEGFTATQAITVNPMVIGKTNMALTTLYWEYTGEPITVYFTVWGYKYEEVPASEYTVTYSNNVEIGKATVTFTDNPGGNYEVNATLTFNIVEAELKDVSVSQNGTLTYTGEAQTPTVKANATTVDGAVVTFTYSATENGTYSAELPTFTNAGTYTVYFKANAANHNEIGGSFEIVVGKATNTWETAPSIKGWTYGEYENTPTATPKFGEVDFSSFSYRLKGTLSWTNTPPSEAGIYEMRARVQATDNWELLETTIEFEIKKATPTADIFDFTPPENLDVCDGSAKEATVTVKEAIEGVGSVTVKYFKNGEPITGAPTTVGTYTVKIEVAEGANFLASESFLTDASWTFTFDVTDEVAHTNVTLSSNGNGTHNKVCSACEKVIESNITCSDTTTDDCDKGYKCSCGGYFGTKEHNFSGDYLSDSEGHWHECADCGATDTKTAHTPENDDGSCLTDIKCSVCDYVTTEAKNEHAFDNSCDTTCGNKGCTHTREITHTPRNDDGDCTTAIHCAVCDAMTTPGNPSHEFDNSCDTDCNRTGCNHIRTITHIPDEDDGSCLTEVLCSICNAVTTEAKNEHGFDNSCDTTCGNKGCTHTREITHTPRDDDGDCTTAIHCAVCDAMTTPSNPSHDFDNSCDADCNRTGCNYTRTITHAPNEDDGNCTTAIHCSICDAITTQSKSHSFTNACDTDCNNDGCTHTRTTEHIPEADDGDCTTDILCSICDAVTTEGNSVHTGGTATCQAKANCSVCGTAYGELDANNHSKTTFVYTANADGLAHTKKYECCGEIALDSEAHTYGADNKCVCGAEKPATSEEPETPITPQEPSGGSGCSGNIANTSLPVMMALSIIGIVFIVTRRKKEN